MTTDANEIRYYTFFVEAIKQTGMLPVEVATYHNVALPIMVEKSYEDTFLRDDSADKVAELLDEYYGANEYRAGYRRTFGPLNSVNHANEVMQIVEYIAKQDAPRLQLPDLNTVKTPEQMAGYIAIAFDLLGTMRQFRSDVDTMFSKEN